MTHEKAYIVDPITGDLQPGFYITTDHDAIKVSGGKAWVNGIEKTLRIGTSGIRVDADKYSRTLSRRLSGLEHSDALIAEPPVF